MRTIDLLTTFAYSLSNPLAHCQLQLSQPVLISELKEQTHENNTQKWITKKKKTKMKMPTVNYKMNSIKLKQSGNFLKRRLGFSTPIERPLRFRLTSHRTLASSTIFTAYSFAAKARIEQKPRMREKTQPKQSVNDKDTTNRTTVTSILWFCAIFVM